MTDLKSIDGMKPALQEFYWLIQKDKITESEFTEDMLHRLNIIRLEAYQKGMEEIAMMLTKEKYEDTQLIARQEERNRILGIIEEIFYRRYHFPNAEMAEVLEELKKKLK